MACALSRLLLVLRQTWWCAHVHLHLDLKNFPVYLTGKTRGYAAMREVRGAYRARGGGLGQGYTTVPKHLRNNPARNR